ncbi:MAG: radical SAM protein [Chloroflexi bacterium]|nr:radical SAM protein [Chloroflexota bacterium]
MTQSAQPSSQGLQTADHIFYSLTRSICPHCRKVIDAQILLKDGRVIMRKRCPDHGWMESLVNSDAEYYVNSQKYNKPGNLPLKFSTEVVDGCPLDCGLCPEHKQHTCLALIEVNTACNLACPTCFANAGRGYNLSMEEVEGMLDSFVELEGRPEVVQFSGGEPTLHPQIIDMMRMAQDKGVRHVMLNTNGVRIARDDRFLAQLDQVRPFIYLQFDGLEDRTYRILRGEDLVETKLQALERLAEIDLDVILVPAIERGVNEHEIGAVLKFGLEHPAVRGINFQPVTHVGRHQEFDPMDRVDIPEVIKAIAAQSDGLFLTEDFVPVPCCFPTCSAITYAYIDEGEVTPLPRVLKVDDYLDYITNRAFPNPELDIRAALESLWSASSVPGSQAAIQGFSCAGCNFLEQENIDLQKLKKHIFMVRIQDFMDAYNMDIKTLMKCCVGQLVPDGRIIPFCAYNSVGYREQVRAKMALRGSAR